MSPTKAARPFAPAIERLDRHPAAAVDARERLVEAGVDVEPRRHHVEAAERTGEAIERDRPVGLRSPRNDRDRKIALQMVTLRTGRGPNAGWRSPRCLLKPPLNLPEPSSATPTGPNGVASAMLLSATSSTKLGSSNGLFVGGGRSRSIWPQLTLPWIRPSAQPHAAREDPIDLEAAVPLQPHLDDRVLGDEVRPLGIADDQIVDLLRAEADAVEVIARGDSAPLELALQIMRGDRPPLDPDDARSRSRAGSAGRVRRTWRSGPSGVRAGR